MVIFDSSLEQHVDALRAKGPNARETGLLLGCHDNSNSEVVVALVPTPPTEGNLYDPDWFAAHAQQVSRMLPVGLRIVGVYFYAPSTADKASQTAATICNAVLRSVGSGDTFGLTRFLVVLKKSVAASLSCHQFKIERTMRDGTTIFIQSPMAPAQFKFQAKANQRLSKVTSVLPVDLSICLPSSGTKASNHQQAKQHLKAISQTLKHVAAELLGAPKHRSNVILTCGGLPVDENASCDGGVEYEFEVSFAHHNPLVGLQDHTTGNARILGVADLSARLACCAFVHQDESMREAKSRLLRDAAKTLLVRLAMLKEELDDVGEELDDDELSALETAFFQESKLAFPRRVFHDLSGQLQCCEYLSTEESVDDVVATWTQMIGLPVATENVKCPEQEMEDDATVFANNKSSPGFPAAHTTAPVADSNTKDTAPTAASNSSSVATKGDSAGKPPVFLLFAAVVAILAVVLALMFAA